MLELCAIYNSKATHKGSLKLNLFLQNLSCMLLIIKKTKQNHSSAESQ